MMGTHQAIALGLTVGIVLILCFVLIPLVRPGKRSDEREAPSKSASDLTSETVKPGTVRFSPWFGHYLEVVTFRSDDYWSFRVIDDPRYPGVYAAQSKFSWLPERGPEQAGITLRLGMCNQSMMPSLKASQGWWCSLPEKHQGACAVRSSPGTPSEYIEREALSRRP